MVILDLGARSEVNSEVRRSFWSRSAKDGKLKVFEKIWPEVEILISDSKCEFYGLDSFVRLFGA